jgi:hypothetical protein
MVRRRWPGRATLSCGALIGWLEAARCTNVSPPDSYFSVSRSLFSIGSPFYKAIRLMLRSPVFVMLKSNA